MIFMRNSWCRYLDLSSSSIERSNVTHVAIRSLDFVANCCHRKTRLDLRKFAMELRSQKLVLMLLVGIVEVQLLSMGY